MITQLQYIDNLTDAIAKRAFRYTPQIYRLRKTTSKVASPYEAIGSSVLLRIKGRHFLITAGHIIKDYKIGKIGFLEEEPFQILSGRFIYSDPDYDKLSKYTDIAICELNNESRSYLTKYFDFLDESEINFDYIPKNTKNFLLVGYPWRKTRYNFVQNKMKVIPYKFLTDIFENEVTRDLKIFRDQNLILAYTQREILNSKTGLLKKSVNPEGMSGGGVWHIPNLLVEDESNAVSNLSGIIIRQDKHANRYMVATRIHIVSEMLRIYFDLDIRPSNITRLNKH